MASVNGPYLYPVLDWKKPATKANVGISMVALLLTASPRKQKKSLAPRVPLRASSSPVTKIGIWAIW